MMGRRYIQNGNFRFSSNGLPSAAPPPPLMLQPPRQLQQSVGAVIAYTPKDDTVIELDKPRLNCLIYAWMCLKYTFLCLVTTLAWITLGEIAELFDKREAFNYICLVVFVFKNRLEIYACFKYLLSNIKIALCIICIVLFFRNQESWYRYQAQMDARVCVCTCPPCTPFIMNIAGGDLPKNSSGLNITDVPLASTPVVEPTPVINDLPVLVQSNQTVASIVSNVINATREFFNGTRNAIIDIALVPSKAVDDTLNKAQRVVDLGHQTQNLARESIFLVNDGINVFIKLCGALWVTVVAFISSRKLFGF